MMRSGKTRLHCDIRTAQRAKIYNSVIAEMHGLPQLCPGTLTYLERIIELQKDALYRGGN